MKLAFISILAVLVAGAHSFDRVIVRQGSSLPGSDYEAVLWCDDMEYDDSFFSQTLVDDEHTGFLVRTKTEEAKLQVQALAINNRGDLVSWFPDEQYAVVVVPSDETAKLDDALFLCQIEMFEHIMKIEDVPQIDFQVSTSQADVFNKQAIVNSMNTNEYTETLGLLSGARTHSDGTVIRTRQSTTTGYQYASQYMSNYLASQALCDEVFFQTFTVQGRQSRNVICVKRGSTNPNEIVVVGGHLDSTSEQSATLAPGAVDDGSGSAGVMILAKAFASYRFSRTIHFIGFGGEEQGLVGSTFYVNNLGNNGYNVVSAYLQDMTAYSNRFYGVIVEGTPNGQIQQLMQLYRTNLQSLTPQLSVVLSNNSFGSDHVPFQRAGIPAILLIERDDTAYPHYHRSTDTLDKTTPAQGTDIAKALAGSVYDSAGFVGKK